MGSKPLPSETRRNLRAITIDGAMFSVMTGLGETYLPAFVLAVGLGELAAGLIVAVPMLAGALLQLAAPRAVRRVGSIKRWVILCATVQATSFIPLIVAAVTGFAPAWLVFPVATIYWATQMATGPAWNTWVTHLIPSSVRARYFAFRIPVTQICLLLSLISGGLFLQRFSTGRFEVTAFAVLFLAAGISRLVSTRYLRRHSESNADLLSHRRVDPRHLLMHMRRRKDSPLLLYMLFVQIARQLAAPYFTPFMIERLNFSYGTYMTLIAAAFASKIIVLPFFGRLAKRLGAKTVLWIGGASIIPLASLWIVSSNFFWLLFVQILAGCATGAYELGTFLLLFERIPKEERTSVLTTFNLLNAVAVVCGASLGALLLKTFMNSAHAYYVLFVVSTCARVPTLILLNRVTGLHQKLRSIALRPLAARPSVGSVDAPFLLTAEEDIAPETKDNERLEQTK